MVFGHKKTPSGSAPVHVVPLAASGVPAGTVGLTNVTLAQPALIGQQTMVTQTALPTTTQYISTSQTAMPLQQTGIAYQQTGYQQTGFQQTGIQQTGFQQTTTTTASRNFLQGSHETVMMQPIIDEHIRTDRIVEVQPIIHKEIDQQIINHIEQHVTQAPAANMGGTVQLRPVIQETIISREIDEITPVIHREVATTTVERIEEHLQERVVAPVQHTNQVVQEKIILQQGMAVPAFQPAGGILAGSAGGIPTATVSGPDLNRNGIPDQLEGRMGLQQQGFAGQPGLMAGQPGFNPNDLNRNGIPDQLEGRMGLGQQGFAGQPGFVGQPGLMAGQPGVNPNDLNRNGIPDQLEGRSGLGLQQQGFAGQPGLMAGQPGFNPNDRNRNGIPDQLEGRRI